MNKPACLRVKASLCLFNQMITTGYVTEHVRCIQGLPEGAELVNISFERHPDSLVMDFYHPDWSDCGDEPQEIAVEFSHTRGVG